MKIARFGGSILLFVAIGVALACSGYVPPMESAGPSAVASASIINGSSDDTPSHAAVVLIVNSKKYVCSGTLIAPRHVLTAGHCVSDEKGSFLAEPSGYTVYFGHDLESFTASSKATAVYRHPEYDTAWREFIVPSNDLAMLEIADPPSDVTPIPVLPASLALGLVEGVTLDISGFGRTESSGVGTKQHLALQLAALCLEETGCGSLFSTLMLPWTLRFDVQEGGPCFGDSGGPAFFTVDGQEYVAGVSSYVSDTACSEFSVSVKVDHFEPFINAVLGILSKGSACSAAENCLSRSCVQEVCCDAPCDEPCHACSVQAGAAEEGHCTPLSGLSCDDQDACTVDDWCIEGACVGGRKDCPEPEACHVSECNPATGECEYPVLENGTACRTGPELSGGKCQDGACMAEPPDECGCTASGGGSALAFVAAAGSMLLVRRWPFGPRRSKERRLRSSGLRLL